LHPEQLPLAERLFRLRKDAGLTGDRLAEQLGWGATGSSKAGRTKVSKIENGRQVPSPGEIRAWTLAAGHPEAAGELLELLADMKVQHSRWRSRLKKGGQESVQRDFDTRTRAATRFRNAELVLIPGLLQTTAYARSVITQAASLYPEDADVDAAVQARMRRQDVLYDTSKTFEFILTEAALRLMPCRAQVMLGQLDRLLSFGLDNVTLGIIPFGQAQLMPLNSFYMLDDDLTVESWTGKIEEHGGEQAALYDRIFGVLMSEAVTGEDARRLIASAAEDLRTTLMRDEARNDAALPDQRPRPTGSAAQRCGTAGSPGGSASNAGKAAAAVADAGRVPGRPAWPGRRGARPRAVPGLARLAHDAGHPAAAGGDQPGVGPDQGAVERRGQLRQPEREGQQH
jgi:transcriptional regulator with XRE-family HTH domain